jgi:hypothetical protein
MAGTITTRYVKPRLNDDRQIRSDLCLLLLRSPDHGRIKAGTHRTRMRYNPGRRQRNLSLPHSLSCGNSSSDPCHPHLFNRIKVPEDPDLTPIFKGCIADGTHSTTLTFFHHRNTVYKIIDYFITASAGFLGALELWQFLKWRYAGIHSRFEISLFSGL